MIQQPQTLDRLFTKLSLRTVRDLDTLHFVEQDGEFKCLDFNLHAVSWPRLIELVEAKLASMYFTERLPSAPKEEWTAIWGNKMLWRRILPQIINPVSGHFVAGIMIKL